MMTTTYQGLPISACMLNPTPIMAWGRCDSSPWFRNTRAGPQSGQATQLENVGSGPTLGFRPSTQPPCRGDWSVAPQHAIHPMRTRTGCLSTLYSPSLSQGHPVLTSWYLLTSPQSLSVLGRVLTKQRSIPNSLPWTPPPSAPPHHPQAECLEAPVVVELFEGHHRPTIY